MHIRPHKSMSVRNQANQVRGEAQRLFYIHSMRWINLGLHLALRAIRRPALAIGLLKVGWRFRSRNWYRRFPFLPTPDRTYVRWRMYTAYGSYDFIPPARDVERYTLWAVSEQ